MLTATPTTNGRPQRKQLCEQLDRLDTILNGLGEALNDSVADAVRTGTRLAVKEAIIEILTDPNLRLKLLETAANQQALPARKPSILSRFVAKARAMASAIAQTAVDTTQTMIAKTGSAARTTAKTVRFLNSVFADLKTLVLIGVGVGLTVCVASYIAPHGVAAALSGIGGAVTAIAIRVGMFTRKAFRATTA